VKKVFRKKMLKVSLSLALFITLILSQSISGYCAVLTVPAGDYAQYVGDAYDSLTNNFRGTALENVAAVRQAGNYSQTATYEIIETSEQIKNYYHKNISLTANGGYSGFTADDNYSQNLENIMNINNSSIYIVLMYKIDAGTVSISSANFSSYAADLINSGQKSTFEGIYGNSFVKNAKYGGILSIVFKSEINSSSTVSKTDVRNALTIKARSLFGLTVSNDELSSAEATISRTTTSSFCYSTDNPSINAIGWDRQNVVNKCNEFVTYYDNLRQSGTGEYYVFSRELSPYWLVPGSGYTNSSEFPAFYDSGVFYASNASATSITETSYGAGTSVLSWQDNCTFEDGFRVYIKTNSMTVPTLYTTLNSNTTSTTLNLDADVLENGAYAWAVPVKNGITGSVFGTAYIEPLYRVTMYEHANYGGRFNKYYGEMDIPNLTGQYVSDNMVSSINIVGRYDVTVYEHPNYQGASHTYRFSDTSVSNEPIQDNRISSVIIRRVPASEYEGVYLYQHADYSGRWGRYTSDVNDISGTYMNDTASSVRIIGPHHCWLFANPGYQGSNMYCTDNVSNLVGSSVGNDVISSISFPDMYQKANFSLNRNFINRGYYGSPQATPVGNYGWTAAGSNYALSLGGAGYATIPNPGDFDNMDAFTITAWINPSAENFNASIITKEMNFGLKLENGYVVFGLYLVDDDWLGCDTDFKVPLNTWSHVAAVYSGTRSKIYYNGNLTSEQYADGAVLQWGSNQMNIGEADDAGSHFKGKIDEVRIYNRAFSDTEINQVYNLAR